MEASPEWQGGKFVNPQPLHNDFWGMTTAVFHKSRHVSPDGPIPVVSDAGRALKTPPASGLRATWLGHSTVLVEIDGHCVLTDPIWSDRASPLGWVGPRRWFAPPLPLAELRETAAEDPIRSTQVD